MLSVGSFAGFSEPQLKARFCEDNSTLSLLNYLVKPKDMRITDETSDTLYGDDEKLPLATSWHTDAAAISILWQRQPGLQAQAPNGCWRDVPMIKDCLSVHLGTVLEIMTGGKVPSCRSCRNSGSGAENWAVRKSRLLCDGQITELIIHTYPFDDEEGRCFGLGASIVYRSSPQYMPHFTNYSTHKGHSQNAVHSS